MKSTTKIFIGILLSGLMVMVVTIILFCTGKKSNEPLLIAGKYVQVAVAPFRVVNVLMESGDKLNVNQIYISGDLTLSPVVDGQHTFSYPEGLDHYLSLGVKDDTLNLTFRMTEHTLSNEYINKESIHLVLSEMKLTVDSSLVAVRAANIIDLNLRLLKLDSIALSASSLKVDSCHFHSLSVQDTRRCDLKNSQIHNVYLDVDGIDNWTMTNCRCENEYLTGSNSHYNVLEKGECNHLYWKPKKENAELKVTLKEEASVSLLE